MSYRTLWWLRAFSLVLLAAILWLWFMSANVFVRAYGGRVLVIFPDTDIQQYSQSDGAFGSWRLPYDITEMYGPSATRRLRVLGFEYISESRAVLLAAPALALAIVPAGAAIWSMLALRRHHRRRRDGLCLACGYDLRGSASDRCPECGAASSAAVSSTH